MSGTVAVAADMLGRYTNFTQSLTSLQAPAGTAIDFRLGADRGRSRNSLVEAALERGSEWVFFIDDDHSFPPDILVRLLAHEMPIVAALYIQRSDPFLPIAYTRKDDDGAYWPLDLNEREHAGLEPVVGAGTGGMLIRREVFETIERPWFVHTTQQSEDLYFCDRVVEAGWYIYVDLEARMGHLTVMNVFPDWDEQDGWAAALSVSASMKARLPINMPLDD